MNDYICPCCGKYIAWGKGYLGIAPDNSQLIICWKCAKANPWRKLISPTGITLLSYNLVPRLGTKTP